LSQCRGNSSHQPPGMRLCCVGYVFQFVDCFAPFDPSCCSPTKSRSRASFHSSFSQYWTCIIADYNTASRQQSDRFVMRCICICRSGAQSQLSSELSKSSQNPRLPRPVQPYLGPHTLLHDHARRGHLQCSSTPRTHRNSYFHNLDRIASSRHWMQAHRHQTAILP
jgi:hypothetical protein